MLDHKSKQIRDQSIAFKQKLKVLKGGFVYGSTLQNYIQNVHGYSEHAFYRGNSSFVWCTKLKRQKYIHQKVTKCIIPKNNGKFNSFFLCFRGYFINSALFKNIENVHILCPVDYLPSSKTFNIFNSCYSICSRSMATRDKNSWEKKQSSKEKSFLLKRSKLSARWCGERGKKGE